MAVGERLFHILEAQQFSREFLEGELFPHAKLMEQLAQERILHPYHTLSNRAIGIIFYEPSTRTRVSFERATSMLGGIFHSTENASEFSSAIKGETIEDTTKIYNGYDFDALVIRHQEDGALARAAAVSDIPIINAGDGKGQHPTQALLDIYTVKECLGAIDGVRVVIVGDLHRGRTVHSKAYLLGKFKGVSIDFVSPPRFRIPQGIKDYLDRHEVSYREVDDLKEVVSEADVVYMTRPQLERSDDEVEGQEGVFTQEAYDLAAKNGSLELLNGKYIFNEEALNRLPNHAIVMHPLPRTGELPAVIDKDPRAAYFRQAKNGLYIRMALLNIIFNR